MRFESIVLASVFVLLGSMASAQPEQLQLAPATPVGTPTATAVAVAEGPSLDGNVLDDAVWQQAPVIGGFWQEQPDEGAPASENTEVRIVFTRETLYVGVVCFDRSPG